MKKALIALTVLFIISCFFNIETAEKPGFKVTGTYSDMNYIEEAGDLIGTEIFVSVGKNGYFVLFQRADGEPENPILVPANVNGATLQFTLRPVDRDDFAYFHGVFYEDRLEGYFSQEMEGKHKSPLFVLKRKVSYWH